MCSLSLNVDIWYKIRLQKLVNLYVVMCEFITWFLKVDKERLKSDVKQIWLHHWNYLEFKIKIEKIQKFAIESKWGPNDVITQNFTVDIL